MRASAPRYNAGMRSLRALAETASDLSVPLSLVLKSDLGREVLGSTSRVAGLVLQGGGALHHVFGSPGSPRTWISRSNRTWARRGLAARPSHAAAEASRTWGACTLEAAPSKGRLHRQKLRVAIDAGTSHVLAIERYEVPVHGRDWADLGRLESVRVESPAEIIADKVVAAVDRFSAGE